MLPIIEKLYYQSPIFFQNIMVSAYGAILAYRRYGRSSKIYSEELKKVQWFTKERIKGLQEKLFLKFVKHALTTVPFYRDWYRNSGLQFGDISGLSDIEKLPIIEKDHIRENPTRFCSDIYLKRRDTFWLSTSGTGGKPIKILCDKESRRRHYAFWTRFREWHGIAPGTKRATFFGRIMGLPDQEKPPFWRYDFFGRNILFSSYHLSEKNLSYYYEKLMDMQPMEIIGYPSSLFAIAKYIKKTGRTEIRPRRVITTAETLLPYQRDLIEGAFRCKVADQYGCTEMAFFISQCEYGSYHIHPEHGFVEVINKEGKCVENEHLGELVCTGLVNMAMPLLRYRLGDQISLSSKKCKCGRSFPMVKEILGRVDDILVTPDGRPLGRLDPVFKALTAIYETQIIQKDKVTLEIRMVVDPNFTGKHMREFMYELRKRTGNEMKIEIRIVDEIPKDSNGKFRAVVSMLKDNER